MPWHLVFVFLLLLVALQNSSARDVYVTDVLQLQLRETPESTAKDVQKLKSGDRLIWLEEQSGFSKVQTENGQTGWVKSWFLVDKPPASTLLQNAENVNLQLNKQVETLHKQIKQLKDSSVNEKLQAKIEYLQNQLDENEQNYKHLMAENTSLHKDIAKFKFLDTRNLFLVAASITGAGFLTGIVVSMLYRNSRQRKRLSGFRLAE